MKKSTSIVKKLLALFLVVLMSINTLGAVVSDNDGSAFITKAEFDSLKNNFQSQINQYNNSIDNKIDGAIASYLAGINVSKKSVLTDLSPNYSSIDDYSVYFAEKSAFSDTNNNVFTRGGWWLFWVYGWNTAWNVPNGIINIVNAVAEDHRLMMKPDTVDSKKFWVKKINIAGNEYYGPYSDQVVNVVEEVSLQRIISTWANKDWHWKWNIRTTDTTFDLSGLVAPGTVNVGSFDSGWITFDNILGTITMLYNPSSYSRRWRCQNSSGLSEALGGNYCIDYDNRFVLSETRQDSSRFTGTKPGIQFQEFNGRDGSSNTDGTGLTTNHPMFTLKFKTPKVLTLRNADMVNWVASQVTGVKIPQYAGLPIVNLPGKGKIKFKYKVRAFYLSNGSEASTPTSTIAFKSNQFVNSNIAGENQADLLYVADSRANNVEYDAEFEIDDAESDGSSYLYVKIAPSSDDVYARVDIIGDIAYTEENTVGN